MSDYIRTYTGKKFYPLDPDPADVDLIDIAHSLSLQARFTGHTERHLSVGEHSLFVAQLTRHDMFGGLYGLLHDASEAYLVDVPSPVKHDPAFAFYRKAEKAIQEAIMYHFNLPLDEPSWVKRADKISLMLEASLDMPEEFAGDVADWEEPTDEHWDEYMTFLQTNGYAPSSRDVEGLFIDTYYAIAANR